MEYLYTFLPLVAIFVIMYFLLIRPQKKKDNAIAKMRDEIQAGDEIVTIGGIVGKIIKIKGDNIILQVGASKTNLEMTKWAISTVTKKNESSSFVPESLREAQESEPEVEEEKTATIKRKRFVKKETADLEKSDDDMNFMKDSDDSISD